MRKKAYDTLTIYEKAKKKFDVDSRAVTCKVCDTVVAQSKMGSRCPVCGNFWRKNARRQ